MSTLGQGSEGTVEGDARAGGPTARACTWRSHIHVRGQCDLQEDILGSGRAVIADREGDGIGCKPADRDGGRLRRVHRNREVCVGLNDKGREESGVIGRLGIGVLGRPCLCVRNCCPDGLESADGTVACLESEGHRERLAIVEFVQVTRCRGAGERASCWLTAFDG